MLNNFAKRLIHLPAWHWTRKRITLVERFVALFSLATSRHFPAPGKVPCPLLKNPLQTENFRLRLVPVRLKSSHSPELFFRHSYAGDMVMSRVIAEVHGDLE